MTVKELIEQLNTFPNHQQVRVLDEDTDETIGIKEVLQDYDTDNKLIVIIKPYYIM